MEIIISWKSTFSWKSSFMEIIISWKSSFHGNNVMEIVISWKSCHGNHHFMEIIISMKYQPSAARIVPVSSNSLAEINFPENI
jgi:hypothetical protein